MPLNLSGKLSIELKGLEFFAFHGAFDQERKVGNRFIVDLTVNVAVTDGMCSDSLDGTVSYCDLFDIVREEMAKPSKLLEHVALRIAGRIKSSLGAVESGNVRIAKCRPPIAGFNGEAAVVLDF